MKKLLLTFAALAVTLASSFGQGQVFFVNRVSGSFDNRAVFQGTSNGVPGPEYKAQLVLVGAGGIGSSDLTAVGAPVPFRTGNLAGTISGVTVTVPTIPEGGKANLGYVVFQGDTFSTAGILGRSAAAEFTLGGTLATPPTTVFTPGNAFVQVVPEPSTIALGVLGAAALLLRRRK